MSARMEYAQKFIIPPRIEKLRQRSRELAVSGRRNLYTADPIQLVYHWTDKSNGIVPQTGEWSYPKELNMSLGDHACRVDIGMAFPKLSEVPSKVYGYEATAESWARDYAFLMDNSPAEIYENEYIVGEFHWEMNEIRRYEFPQEVYDLAAKARELGCGGTSHGHTCPDLAIGLSQGWGGILERIKRSREKYEKLHNKQKVSYLTAAQTVCESVIRFIQKHSDRALELAEKETDPEQKKIYQAVADCCANIAYNAPGNYYEAVQWIQFNVVLDRIVGHGNGYGRLDQYLIDFYKKGIADATLTREEARNYLVEMFLKLRGQFFCLGGRDREGRDATNEMSWVVMEAYDMIDDYNNLGVMWHPDMDEKFYEYVCDVLARHGAGVPSLINYDIMRDAQLRSGVDEEDAWNVAYSGCQWFCIPGKEYCDQDVNAFVLIEPMRRAIQRGIEEKIQEFEELYQLFIEELKRTARVMREFKDVQYDALPYVWPEIFTSLNCHGPIERGLDMTAPRGVDVQYTSTNFLGIPNVADSLFAIKKMVFEKKMYTLKEVAEATATNWKDNEVMRQRFLNQDKYGNDLDEVDALYVRITESIADVMDNLLNNRGQSYRASLFQFQGQTCPTVIGATPDGRYAEEFLAHGCNPTPGRNTKGLLSTANSLAKVDYQKFQGGSLQIELQPKFFDGKEEMWKYIRDFSVAFFRKGGMQINLNILDLNKLKEAINHPEDPAYQNIIIKVTGYTTRFVCLDKAFQKEFVGRVNYEGF